MHQFSLAIPQYKGFANLIKNAIIVPYFSFYNKFRLKENKFQERAFIELGLSILVNIFKISEYSDFKRFWSCLRVSSLYDSWCLYENIYYYLYNDLQGYENLISKDRPTICVNFSRIIYFPSLQKSASFRPIKSIILATLTIFTLS